MGILNKLISSAATISESNKYHIICDFDGTITPFDVTNAILQRFAPPEWENIEEKWVAGKISAKECMEQQVALLNVAPDTLDAFLAKVPVDKSFHAFYALCQELLLPVTVLSDGIDYAIEAVLSNHGLQSLPVMANRLVQKPNNRYCLEFPYHVAPCPSGMCKCAIAKRYAAPILLIGDGLSDCCIAGIADFIFAKEGKTLQEHCIKNRYPHATYKYFSDILREYDSKE